MPTTTTRAALKAAQEAERVARGGADAVVAALTTSYREAAAELRRLHASGRAARYPVALDAAADLTEHLDDTASQLVDEGRAELAALLAEEHRLATRAALPAVPTATREVLGAQLRGVKARIRTELRGRDVTPARSAR